MENSGQLINVLKMALIKENRALVFYRRLSEEATSNELKELFKSFSEEERGHFDLLNKKIIEIKHNNKITFFPETENTVEKYHNAVWNKELIKELNNADYLAAAISAAASVEEEAVKFYEEEAQKADSQEAKSLFLWLSQWEREHFKLLKKIDETLMEEIWHDNRFWPDL